MTATAGIRIGDPVDPGAWDASPAGSGCTNGCLRGMCHAQIANAKVRDVLQTLKSSGTSTPTSSSGGYGHRFQQ